MLRVVKFHPSRPGCYHNERREPHAFKQRRRARSARRPVKPLSCSKLLVSNLVASRSRRSSSWSSTHSNKLHIVSCDLNSRSTGAVMESASSGKRPAQISTNKDKEDGELDASAHGDTGTPTAKKGRRNRGGKGRSANIKKQKPASSASDTAIQTSALLVSADGSSALGAGAEKPSLLAFLSPLLASSVADPLLISEPVMVDKKVENPPRAAAIETEKPKAISKMREFVPRLPCKFFVKGRCEKGTDCTFSHAIEIPKKLEVCKFYKSGVCRKGDECAFSHSFKDEICLYLLKGECTAGSQCKYSHDLQALAEGKIAGPPAPASVPGAANAATAAKPAATAPPASASGATLATSATNTRPLVIALSESSSEDS